MFTNSSIKLPTLAEAEKNRKYYKEDTRTNMQREADAKAEYMPTTKK